MHDILDNVAKEETWWKDNHFVVSLSMLIFRVILDIKCARLSL